MYPRPFYQKIWQELAGEKPMVFMPGPRQTGKTTLAQWIAEGYVNHLYFNWDIPDHRSRLIKNPFFFQEIERRNGSKPLIILDEIHKYRDWKNYLKGVYDQFKDEFLFLISGSGRLDIYQKGGDSLAGRYYQFHLWPFTLAELSGIGRTVDDFKKMPLEISTERGPELEDIWAALGRFSGFPEPYLTGREASYRRWTNTYSRQLIREDIRDLTNIKAIGDLETLYYLLPSKVGSPISISSLSGDLKIAYNTARNWLATFEQFFLIFSIPPWTREIARAIQKERKIYLWDSARIKNPAARLENMVALELYRALTIWNDMGWGRFTLHFIKNKEKQEVDFLIADENKPLLLIETKLSDTQPSAALLKFQSALNVPAVQLTNRAGGYRLLTSSGQPILIAPSWQWVCALPW
jgi:predicted AAA+ superfamily ATPase